MLLKEFRSDIDLLDYFSQKSTCVSYLEQYRWNGNPYCPHCYNDKYQKLKDGRYRCSDKLCYKKYSVLVGTFLENTKIPLRKWFLAIYLSHSGLGNISSYNLSKRIGVCQKTSWFMCQRISAMTQRGNLDLFDRVTKIDETYVGATLNKMCKKRRAKYPEQYTGYAHRMSVIGLIGVDGKGNNKIVLEHSVKNATKKDIQPIVRKYVHPSSILVTDQSGVYAGLEREYKERIILNHSLKEYKKDGYHGNDIEGSFRHLKDRLGATHKGRVGEKHMQLYLDSFSFRYNTSKLTDFQRMNVLLGNLEGRLKYNDLVGKRPRNVDEDGVVME